MKWLFRILSFLTPLVGPAVLAGGMEGGGGKGVLCGNVLQTLDVYEAENIHHFPSTKKYPALDDNTLAYGTSLLVYWSNYETTSGDPNIRNAALQYSHKLLGLFRDVSSALPLTPDATLPPIPPTCSFVQIAIYDDAINVIRRDLSLWNMLDPYNQTALIWHEIYYHAAREVHATTSDETRLMIGMAMTNQLPEPRMKPFFDATQWLECSSDDAAFGFRGRDEIQNGIQGVTLYAEVFEGLVADFRTIGFLPGISIKDFGANSTLSKSWQTQVQNTYSNESWNFDLTVSGLFGSSAKMRAWKNGQTKPELVDGSCVLWSVGGLK